MIVVDVVVVSGGYKGGWSLVVGYVIYFSEFRFNCYGSLGQGKRVFIYSGIFAISS